MSSDGDDTAAPSMPPTLAATASDYAAALARAGLGAIPLVGPAIGEFIAFIIPKQRIDRLCDFALGLSVELEQHSATIADIEARLRTPEGADLLEECCLQAMRAVSPERRKQIAALLATAMTTEQFDHARARKLLSILESLLDPELIWLTYYEREANSTGEEFAALHEALLEPAHAELGSSPSEWEYKALQEDFLRTLEGRGLIEDRNGLTSITTLGNMLLAYIGQASEPEVDNEAEESGST